MSTAHLSSQVYRHLRQQLISGKLLPGAVVSENMVATEMGISRTPVGEAVRQLAAEGLFEQVPRYGTVVKEITRQNMEEIYEVREAIESYAAGKAARNISNTQLEQLAVLCHAIEAIAEQLDASESEAIDGDTLRQFLATDMMFHLLIVRAAANSRILKVVEDSRSVSQVFRIRRRRRHDSATVHSACDYHNKILHALRAGDGEKAAQWMYNHIRLSKLEALAFIDQQQTKRLQPHTDFSLELDNDTRAALEKLEGGNADDSSMPWCSAVSST